MKERLPLDVLMTPPPILAHITTSSSVIHTTSLFMALYLRGAVLSPPMSSSMLLRASLSKIVPSGKYKIALFDVYCGLGLAGGTRVRLSRFGSVLESDCSAACFRKTGTWLKL